MNKGFETIYSTKDITGDVGLKLENGIVPGLLIKDFFSKDDIRALVAFYKDSNKVRTFCNYKGFNSFPASFPKFTDLEKKGEASWHQRLEEAELLHSFFRSEAGVLALPRLMQLLNGLFPVTNFNTIVSPESRELPMLSYRELMPGAGEFSAHTETLTFEAHRSYFGEFASKLHSIPYSFFTVLQEPEEGGELCCFDVKENPGDIVIAQGKVKKSDGGILDFNADDNLPRYYIKPKAGDLIVFSSGRIWHRVELVKGGQSRITLGGFILAGTQDGVSFLCG